MKLLFRKKAQDIQGMDIAPWAKLFHTTEEKVNWIVGIHEELAGQCTPQSRTGSNAATKYAAPIPRL